MQFCYYLAQVIDVATAPTLSKPATYGCICVKIVYPAQTSSVGRVTGLTSMAVSSAHTVAGGAATNSVRVGHKRVDVVASVAGRGTENALTIVLGRARTLVGAERGGGAAVDAAVVAALRPSGQSNTKDENSEMKGR
jgi:hypothetical protein